MRLTIVMSCQSSAAPGAPEAMELQLHCHPPSSDANQAACPVGLGAQAADPPTAPMGIALFTEGDALYAAMLESIRGARLIVRMESYLFVNDEIGREFAAALVERAQAGVEVRLHLDAAGAWGNGSTSMERHLRERGVALKWFHRWNWRRPLRYNRRNHRKLLVVDDQLAYVGGFNIHRESSRRFYGDARWRDTHASISGALALDAAKLFDVFWHGHRHWKPTLSGNANLIPNHTGKCRHRIRCLYSDAFAGARERIYLTTPYFVPDLFMQQRLMNAARRGVDVRLLVPSQSDVPLTRWAAQAFYAALITAGVHVYEYLPRMLHAKTIVIDGRWSVIGTANFDYRSFFLNYELVLAVREAGFCAQLERQFHADLCQSSSVASGRWAERRWWRRLLEFVGWTVRRWL
jgi:cardiolipin synthase A/B